MLILTCFLFLGIYTGGLHVTREWKFIYQHYESARLSENIFGIWAGVLLVQAGYESGWGTSSMARSRNNVFGTIGCRYKSYKNCFMERGRMNQNNYHYHSFGHLFWANVGDSIAVQKYFMALCKRYAPASPKQYTKIMLTLYEKYGKWVDARTHNYYIRPKEYYEDPEEDLDE